VPLYKLFCSVTGFAGTPKIGHGKAADEGDVTKRVGRVENGKTLRIMFNSDVSDKLQWSFKPQQRELRLVPGETALAFYTAKNLTDRDITGIASYNITPDKAGAYFNKIQCFCLAAGSMVAGVDGLGRPIEAVIGSQPVLTYAAESAAAAGTPAPAPAESPAASAGGVVAGVSDKLLVQGAKACITVMLEDGRMLVCTEDHQLLTTRGWLAARDVPLDDDSCRVLCGPDVVLDVPAAGEEFTLRLPHLGRTLTLANDRDACFAFVRLLGWVLTDGCIQVHSTNGTLNASLLLGHQLDVDAVLHDLAALGAERVPAVRPPSGVNQVILGEALSRDLLAHSGVAALGERATVDVPVLPPLVTAASTPQCVKREFLAAYFGGDGGAPSLSASGEDMWFEEVQFFLVVARQRQEAGEALLRALQEVLSRDFGFAAGTIDSTRGTKAEDVELRLHLSANDTLRFAERIGFRYACHKTMRLTVAACWYRMQQAVKEMRTAFHGRVTALADGGASLVAAVTQAKAEFRAASNLSEAFLPTITQRAHLAEAERLYSPIKLADWLVAVGARDFFSLTSRERGAAARTVVYAVPRARSSWPVLHLKVASRTAAGEHATYDLSVPRTHAFLANGLVVHNCFEYQRLKANEEVDMPVFFYIDPEFENDPKMRDVDSLILSYTFFEAKEGDKLAANALASSSPPPSA